MAISQVHAPWASGPGEILRHGLELLKKDSDRNRRLCMISVDNAVELMMKTYLGLPKRITGLAITRKEYEECSESFPRLLDAMEKYGSDRLVGIDLGNIEWYHRLRNELYHQGNGLTVERAKVEVYASLAQVLFKNLFGVDPPELPESQSTDSKRLFQFLSAWSRLERTLAAKAATLSESIPPSTAQLLNWTHWLSKTGDLNADEANRLEIYRRLKNSVVRGDLSNLKDVPTDELNALIRDLWNRWKIDEDDPPGQLTTVRK